MRVKQLQRPGYEFAAASLTAFILLAIAILLAGNSNARAGTPAPIVESDANAYWASYADYAARTLTVDETFTYSGVSAAMSCPLRITGVAATNGVTLRSDMPMDIGDIFAPGGMTARLRFYVPEGVVSFHMQASALCLDPLFWGLSDQPAWVQQLIEKYQNDPVGNPPQSIWQYQYHGSNVYYVPPQCCDQFSTLYDAQGNVIGAPDGGYTGQGDGRVPDFFTARSDGVLVWQDSRTG